MFDLSEFAQDFMEATNGTVGDMPRIYNIDQNKYVYGYCEINTMATSAFSRIKVHKGWFACSPSDVKPGDLILDRADNSKYFVMAIKNEFNNGVTVYLDGTLFFTDVTATISRFGGGARDTFGRPSQPGAVVIHSDVSIMINPKGTDIIEQPDSFIERNKIQIYVQEKYGVREADRITTSKGKVYKVESIDEDTLTNIWICTVNKDDR